MEQSGQLSSLSHAVRGAVVGKYLGQLGLVLSVLLTVPLATSLIYGEFRFSLAYLMVIAVTVAWSAPLARLETTSRIQANEALTITTLSFIAGGLVNVPAFLLAGLSPVDALFEAMSGVTTTGLTQIGDVEVLPATVKVARGWSQWYGGLGFVVLSLALLAGHGAASRRLLGSDAGLEELTVNARGYARRALTVYTTLTLAGIVLLVALTMPPLEAFVQVLAAVSTGGFSSFNDSLGSLPGAHVAVLTTLFVCGAVALPIYFLAVSRGWRYLFRDPEVRALLLLTGISACLLAAGLAAGEGLGIGDAIYHGAVLAASAQTTTGFSTMPVQDLPDAMLVWICVSMIIGGGLGSTAGGIKLIRALMAGRMLITMIRRTSLPPSAVTVHWWNGEKLDEHDADRILLVILLFVGVVIVTWLAFLLDGQAPIPALFEVVSAAATVGLSTGITPDLPEKLKLLLCMIMLAGRLEIVALLVFLSPGTWFGRRSESR